MLWSSAPQIVEQAHSELDEQDAPKGRAVVPERDRMCTSSTICGSCAVGDVP